LNGRVAYLIQAAEVSGAERMHAALIREDRDALVICPPGSSAEEFARELGADVAPLSFRPLRHSGGPLETLRSVGRGLGTARELRRVLREHPEREVIFCLSIRPGMLAALASAGLGRRLLWCIPDLLPPAPLRWAVRAMVRRTACGVLCLSEVIAADLAGGSTRLRELATVVYPGVDLDRFDPGAADPGAPVAAVLGHVSHIKRTDLAVDIADRVVAEVPGFRLRIVGRPQFRDEDFALDRELRERVRASVRLSSSVEFAGFATDVAGALAGCGVLLHCRPDEPFGIALIEAMAMGVPVVAPAAAGPLEIVEDGVTGLLYEANDASAGAEALRRLLIDPEAARRMGAAARKRVEERFDLRRQIAETRALLTR
jgi:glycosyltransferase involved in cell wall biosynthesis